jgi:hypothetical protein
VDVENSKTAVISRLLRPDRSAEPDLNGAAAQIGGEVIDRPCFHWWRSACFELGNKGLIFFTRRGDTIKQPWAALLFFTLGQPTPKVPISVGVIQTFL